MSVTRTEFNGINTNMFLALQCGDTLIIQSKGEIWQDPVEIIITEPIDTTLLFEEKTTIVSDHVILKVHNQSFFGCSPICYEYEVYKDWSTYIKSIHLHIKSQKQLLDVIQAELDGYENFCVLKTSTYPEYFV